MRRLSASDTHARGSSGRFWEFLPVSALTMARGVCAVIGLLVIVLDVISIPEAYRAIQIPCSPCDPNGIQITILQSQALRDSGFSMQFFATYMVGLIVVTEMAYICMGTLLFLRRSDDPMALFTSLMLMTFGGAAFTGTMHALSGINELFWLLTGVLNVIGQTSFFIFLYLFPTGHFVPRWTLIPSAIWGLSWVLQLTRIPALVAFSMIVNDGPVFIPLVLSLVGAQIYRYRRVSTPVQKQQTKWVVYGIGLGLTGFALTLVISNLLLPKSVYNNPIGSLAGNTFTYLCFLIIPIAIAVAVLRSRLYDVDILINRTLVYGSLTAILAGIYIGLVISAQILTTHQFTGLFNGQGQEQPIVIVLSTLLIAALFQPLRRWLQHAIDRRFYRSRYDAVKTVAAFSASLRNEVDLAQLNEHLLGVVEETMRPSHVSLWLTPTARSRDTKHPQI